MSFGLLQVDDSSLVKENLAARLYREILDGHIAPGERIVEGKWARQLGVAQTSIREAINILISQGFVQKGHGRSARVIKLSEEDVVQLYQVQAALESTAARLVVERKADLTKLRDAIGAMRAALEGDDLAPIIEAALHFHLGLCESSGNSFLVEQFRRLAIPLYAFTLMRAVVQGVSKYPWNNSLTLFERMMDALGSGDSFFAEQYVLRVIQRFARQACEIWAHDLASPERTTARRRPTRS